MNEEDVLIYLRDMYWDLGSYGVPEKWIEAIRYSIDIIDKIREKHED